MATPIRLLGGLQNELQMDLLAQAIDISVDRNASHFPTPNNILKRFAIDTNTPRVMVEINGVIIGDEGTETHQGGSTITDSSVPLRTLINFGSMLPTEPFSAFKPTGFGTVHLTSYSYATSNINKDFPTFVTDRQYTVGATNTISGATALGNRRVKRWASSANLSAKIQTTLKFTGSSSIGATGALPVETILSVGGSAMSISSNPSEIGASALLNVGDRVVKVDGTFLGEVSALTDTAVTFKDALTSAIAANDEVYVSPKCFNERNEFVGFVVGIYDDSSVSQGNDAQWYIEFSGNIETNVRDGDTLTINQSNPSIEATLHNECVKLVPSYWLESVSRNPKGSLCQTDVTMGQGSGNIGVRFRFNASKTPSLLGGSDAISIIHQAKATSRAFSHTSVSVPRGDAAFFDAVVEIPIKGLTTTAGKNPAVIMAELLEDALAVSGNISSVNVSPTGKTLADAFKVTRHQSIVVVEQIYRPDRDIIHPEAMSIVIRKAFQPQVFQGGGVKSSSAKKSAGDKVQDLIGLVSNSQKDIDMFRGIQIPYDSLITSSGVTGTARNFFLTFGDVPASEKGSLNNTRSASEMMNQVILSSDAGGNVDESAKEGFFDQVIDALVPETVQSLVGFLTGAVEDLFVTLTTPSHGNDGGIRIMPEKLHVRYDAGNNYYAFTLLLVATDFVIGV